MSDVQLTLHSEKVSVRSNSGSPITLNGSCSELIIYFDYISGNFSASSLFAEQLQASHVFITHKSAGNITVFPVTTLQSENFSFGDIIYVNQPKQLNISNHGKGETYFKPQRRIP
ncbi:hypothetical protein GCM10023331_10670 [Algivirga pacifica]|uniref:Putative auto-transporter adhesin head GIN domain-containing protein n=2 Tax=Algivirga pacifica TaxID=1162670 RepID=A0ABP9D7X6_9BACT